jgi:SAM-dependent methyltransferase
MLAGPMSETASSRGQPSFVWRAGQDRRLAMLRRLAAPGGGPALDLGCGLGLYTRALAAQHGPAIGLEVEWPRAREAAAAGVAVVAAVSERLPFAPGSFRLVLANEVLEHVADDRAAAQELVRVLAPGGRAMLFVPNRLWPFETHGVYWRGRYRFGNAPLVNWLPDALRARLAPHVRVYTGAGLEALFAGLPVRIVAHRGVFPGYDNLARRRPRLGRLARRLSYALERTPLGACGLSRLLVVERLPGDAGGLDAPAAGA